MKEVRESSIWASLGDCLNPTDILVLRIIGPKWNNFMGNFLPCGSVSCQNGSEEGAPVLHPEWPACFIQNGPALFQ